MWQANFVRAALEAAWGGLQIELKVITTSGDRAATQDAQAAAEKGMFTKEIELALLAGEIDLAVHSLKDLPTTIPDGLCLPAVPPREDPADALVAKDWLTLEGLSKGAKVLCGSPRRAAQLLARRKDLEILPVRGNVGTRIRKLDQGDASAIVLACAGLLRLGLAERIAQRLNPEDFLPAAGQGALAIEIRAGDRPAGQAVKPLDHAPSHVAVAAERAFLAGLGGGCRMPTGAYGRLSADGKELVLSGLAARPDGSLLLRRTFSAPFSGIEAAEELGRRLAQQLLADGADRILGTIRGANRPSEGN
jgi:hydroxymethylbilane synthase